MSRKLRVTVVNHNAWGAGGLEFRAKGGGDLQPSNISRYLAVSG